MVLDKGRLVSAFNGVFLLQNMSSAERYEEGGRVRQQNQGPLAHWLTEAPLILLCPVQMARNHSCFDSQIVVCWESGKTTPNDYDVMLTKLLSVWLMRMPVNCSLRHLQKNTSGFGFLGSTAKINSRQVGGPPTQLNLQPGLE